MFRCLLVSLSMIGLFSFQLMTANADSEVDCADHDILYVAEESFAIQSISADEPDVRILPDWDVSRMRYWEWSIATERLALNLDYDLYVLEDGAAERLFEQANDGTPTLYLVQDWSPDGTKLLFLFYEQEPCCAQGLVVYEMLTGEIELLTPMYNPVVFPIESAAWSPAGDYIVFGARDDQMGPSDLYIMSTACIGSTVDAECAIDSLTITDGSGERLIIEDEFRPPVREDWSHPIWSPDGETIVFACGLNLCFIRPDGTDFTRSMITTGRGDKQWSPCGRYLTYARDWDIFVADLETGETRNLTNTPNGQEQLPIWVRSDAARALLETFSPDRCTICAQQTRP